MCCMFFCAPVSEKKTQRAAPLNLPAKRHAPTLHLGPCSTLKRINQIFTGANLSPTQRLSSWSKVRTPFGTRKASSEAPAGPQGPERNHAEPGSSLFFFPIFFFFFFFSRRVGETLVGGRNLTLLYALSDVINNKSHTGPFRNESLRHLFSEHADGWTASRFL
jgi:hypothetical protein